MITDLVLGIDTSTVVAVGLARGSQVLGRQVVGDRMAHAERLTPLITQVCGDAGVAVSDCGVIVVGLGPGPFTGLRVGIVTARVLAAVTGARLHGICSLDVIAVEYAETEPTSDFVVATDARRKELYWARYDATGVRIEGPLVSPPNQLPIMPVVGPGADLYPDVLSISPGPRRLDPGLLATRGPQLPTAGESPLYLRRPDAAEPTRRKSVLVRGRGPR